MSNSRNSVLSWFSLFSNFSLSDTSSSWFLVTTIYSSSSFNLSARSLSRSFSNYSWYFCMTTWFCLSKFFSSASFSSSILYFSTISAFSTSLLALIFVISSLYSVLQENSSNTQNVFQIAIRSVTMFSLLQLLICFFSYS